MAAAAPSPTAAVAERRALHKKGGGKAACFLSMLRAACLRSGVSICQSVFMSSAITAFCLCICFVHGVLSFMHRVFPTYPERSVFPMCCSRIMPSTLHVFIASPFMHHASRRGRARSHPCVPATGLWFGSATKGRSVWSRGS